MLETNRAKVVKLVIEYFDSIPRNDSLIYLKEIQESMNIESEVLSRVIEAFSRYSKFKYSVVLSNDETCTISLNEDWEELLSTVKSYLLENNITEIDLEKMSREGAISADQDTEDIESSELGMTKADFGSVLAYIRDLEPDYARRIEQDHWEFRPVTKGSKTGPEKKEKETPFKDVLSKLAKANIYDAKVVDDIVLVKIMGKECRITNEGEVHGEPFGVKYLKQVLEGK